jgi:hypothetical protein
MLTCYHKEEREKSMVGRVGVGSLLFPLQLLVREGACLPNPQQREEEIMSRMSSSIGHCYSDYG